MIITPYWAAQRTTDDTWAVMRGSATVHLFQNELIEYTPNAQPYVRHIGNARERAIDYAKWANKTAETE